MFQGLLLTLWIIKFVSFHVSSSEAMIHTKCRGSFYPFSEVKRLLIQDSEVPWNFALPLYNPPEYNSKSLQNKPWADPDLSDPFFKPKWNEIDGKVDRRTHCGKYQISDGRPLNPMGRTGLRGRGILGKWGPNHAADPIVTRWKLHEGKPATHPKTNLKILQFCAIQRKDCGQWAIPGGMVDPGEEVTETLRREFLEEALNALESGADKVKEDEEMVKKFFKKGVEIYRGYVDDPRNTDNAWMETVAMNFHDDTGNSVGKFQLQAGDDAAHVKWMDIDKQLDLYASHSSFIEKVANLHKAHF